MKKIVDRYTNNIFENIKHTDEYGNEYWYARELLAHQARDSGAGRHRLPGDFAGCVRYADSAPLPHTD